MVVRSIAQVAGPASVLVTAAPMAPRATLFTQSKSEVTFSAIHLGERSFEVTGMGGFWVTPGTRMRAVAVEDINNWIEGQVISYDGETLVIDADLCEGDGTFADWDIGVVGEHGEKGQIGEKGEKGEAGAPGPVTLYVGETTTSAPDIDAKVTNSGDALNVILEFSIPRGVAGTIGGPGAKGEPGVPGLPGVPGPATVAVGTTTTGAIGTDAAVTNSGDNLNVVLDFVIPRGAPGSGGAGIIDSVELPLVIDANGKLSLILPPRAFQ